MGLSKSKEPIIVAAKSNILEFQLNLPVKEAQSAQRDQQFSASPKMIRDFFLDHMAQNGIAQSGMTVFFEPTYKALLNLRLSHIYLRKALLKDLMSQESNPEMVQLVTVDPTQTEDLYGILAQWHFTLQRTISHHETALSLPQSLGVALRMTRIARNQQPALAAGSTGLSSQLEIRADLSWPFAYMLDLQGMKAQRKLKSQGEWKINRVKRNEIPRFQEFDYEFVGTDWDDFGQKWALKFRGSRHAIPTGVDVAKGVVEFAQSLFDELCKDRSKSIQ